MKSIKTKFDLSKADSDVVHVKSVDAIFIRTDDDWVEKKYFTTLEVGKEIGESPGRVREWAMKVLKKTRPFKFDIKEIRTLVEVKRRRERGQRFKDIKAAV